MSKEPRKHDRLEDYLQFTPLLSATPARSIIASFQTPRVRLYKPPSTVSSEPGQPTTETHAISADVLTHAVRSKGRFNFRPVPSSTCLSSQNVSPSALVKDLLESYLQRSQDYNPAQSASHNLKPYSNQRSSNEQDSSIAGEPCQDHFCPPSQLGSAGSIYELVAVPDDSRQPIVKLDVNSPSKRASEFSYAPESPTKHKKPRNAESFTPLEEQASSKAVDATLLANLQSERAAMLDLLQSCIDDIFEAEDSIEADTSENQGGQTKGLFNMSHTELRLTMDTTQKILVILRKAVRMRVLSSIESGKLLRLQRIFLRSVIVNHAQRLESLECNSDEESEQGWLDMIYDASNSVTSSLCMSSIMEASTDPMEIYSEESLLAIVDGLKSVLDDLYFRWFSVTALSKLVVVEKHRKLLDYMLQSAVGLLSNMSRMLSILETTENIVSRTIFLAVNIIFVESPGKSSKVSSHLIVESLKAAAVGMLQSVFAKFPLQRQFILDEVLSSLNRLPANRQTARQFRLPNGRSIQLVSSLLLHLVQSSTGDVAPVISSTDTDTCQNGDATAVDSHITGAPKITLVEVQSFSKRLASADLVGKHIVDFLLEKSLTSAKSTSTDDAPFKALVDVFIEDFVTVLHLPEWPAAELMLRWIANSMLRLIDSPKQMAQVKVSAVDALSSIACKVRATTLIIREAHKLEGSSYALDTLPSFDLPDSITDHEFQGLEELQKKLYSYLSACLSSEVTFSTSLEYSMVSWTQFLVRSSERKNLQEALSVRILTYASRFVELYKSRQSPEWSVIVGPPPDPDQLSPIYLRVLSFSGLFHMFETILPRLLAMMDHSLTTLRTKTLRSFGRLAEVDPSILSMRSVQNQIAQRMSDSSPQVRDVAIDLLGRHIAANPLLGAQYYPVLRERIMDTGLSVRKRVLKLCRDLYMSDDDENMRIDIAKQFLHRVHDEEDVIHDLVLKSLEIMWFSPIGLSEQGDNFVLTSLNVQEKQVLKSRAAVISAMSADSQDSTAELLCKVLSDSLGKTNSNKNGVLPMLRLLGLSYIEDVIHEVDEVSRLRSLMALKVLAHAVPTCLSSSQMESLLPYLQYGAGKFEQNSPLYVASIYSAVLPTLTSNSVQFLTDIQASLLGQLTKLPVRTLREVVPCVCTAVQLKGDFIRVAKTLKSCLQRITALKVQHQNVPQQDKQIILLLHLIGLFCRYLHLEDVALLEEVFNLKTPRDLVHASLSALLPFCKINQDGTMTPVEKAALQSIGHVCINCPDLFQNPEIISYTDAIMNAGDHRETKRTLMLIYNEYLLVEQRKNDLETKNGDGRRSTKIKENRRKTKKDEVAQVDVTILIGNTDKFATDGISPSLMQRYLVQVLDAALGADLPLAIVATKLIHNIVHQGLANPRNCVPTIIALETSGEARLRNTAAQIHRELYEKHESLIDSCHIDGVKAAFEYRMRMNLDVQPAQDVALISTLYNIVRASRKGRQKFLIALARGLDINLDNIKTLTARDAAYALFIAHNIACLEYSTLEEVHLIIHSIDKVLSTTGMALLQSLDSEEAVSQLQESYGEAAAILSYSIRTREQLKLVYSIPEAKCRMFDPTRLGGRTEAKAAARKADVPLRPNWADIQPPASAEQRIALFTALLSKEDQMLSHIETVTEEQAVADVMIPTEPQ